MNDNNVHQEAPSQNGCRRPPSPSIPPSKLVDFYKKLGDRARESHQEQNHVRKEPPAKEQKGRNDIGRRRERQKAEVGARLRAVAWLWDTTVPLNAFGTDGPKNVPATWPGDRLRRCRLWHGIDMSFETLGKTIVKSSVTVDTPEYVGVTRMCDILGKATTTDRFVSEPRIEVDAGGEFVEVKALLGARLGAYIPDLDVGVATVMPKYPLGPLVQHVIEEMIEDQAEEQYLGTNSWVAKIYNFVKLKVYYDGRQEGTFVSRTPGNGFQTTGEIVAEEIGFSWIPEHHLYLNDQHVDEAIAQSTDGWDETVKWIDSWRPYDVMAFVVLNDAINYWCRNASLEDKMATAQKFREEHPNYYVGTEF